MSNGAKYVWTALLLAVAVHLSLIFAAPYVLMGKAMERIGVDGTNMWHVADRVTAESRRIVRPAPDFAYSACVFDLSDGPIRLRVAPWDSYWSLSLYADNSDNFFVIDDREVEYDAEIVLTRGAQEAPENVTAVASPSTRGIALIRRLAPDPGRYAAAAAAARGDVCAPLTAD